MHIRVETIVDYILMDIEAACMMVSCNTHHMNDLNTSDHLPLSAVMVDAPCVQNSDHNRLQQPRINWDQARKSGEIDDYISEVHNRLSPLLSNTYDNTQQIDGKIKACGMVTDGGCSKDTPTGSSM